MFDCSCTEGVFPSVQSKPALSAPQKFEQGDVSHGGSTAAEVRLMEQHRMQDIGLTYLIVAILNWSPLQLHAGMPAWNQAHRQKSTELHCPPKQLGRDIVTLKIIISLRGSPLCWMEMKCHTAPPGVMCEPRNISAMAPSGVLANHASAHPSPSSISCHFSAQNGFLLAPQSSLVNCT